MRLALGIRYQGTHYCGWQSQKPSAGGRGAVQDHLEKALARFLQSDAPPRVICAGRTDAGVHASMQVVHLDTKVERGVFSWVRGTNTYLPKDIAVQWAKPMPDAFHARACAQARRYLYILLESVVRPSLEAGRVGWVFQALDGTAMQAGAVHLLGKHDFSSFRSSQCQAPSPIKTLTALNIHRQGPYWLFHFEGNAFLHHMVRNIMGCLVMVGQGRRPPNWVQAVLQAKNRQAAAPTFSPDGLYFLGPVYDAHWGLPEPSPSLGILL